MPRLSEVLRHPTAHDTGSDDAHGPDIHLNAISFLASLTFATHLLPLGSAGNLARPFPQARQLHVRPRC